MPTCQSRNRPSPRNDAERRAALWYRLRGYRILAANCWLAGGELDLVVRRGRRIVFCEVKSKTGDSASATRSRWWTTSRCAAFARLPTPGSPATPRLVGLEVRFDVIADRAGRIEHVPNAF